MKKALVILLAFLILTNFHCARFNVQTKDAKNILVSCRATLIDDSEVALVEKKGTLLLTENSLLFTHKGNTRDIPYSQIFSLDIQGFARNAISKPSAIAFTGPEGKKAPSLAVVTGGLAVAWIAILFGLLIFGHYSSCGYIEIHLDSAKGIDMETFKVARGDLAKIYPFLVEKVY